MSDFLLLPFDILVDQLLSPADDFLSPPVLMAFLGENQPDRATGTIQLLCREAYFAGALDAWTRRYLLDHQEK